MLAKKLIATRTTEMLLGDWEATTNAEGDFEEISTVRGWLMDELESRNPKGFERWLMESCIDETLRNYILA